jgi:hypothetical protein
MANIETVWWDLDDDPEGNVQHIAEHDLTKEEVEEVLFHPERTCASNSSGLPLAFGETSTGRYILVAYQLVDPHTAKPVTAYDVPRPRKRKRKKP